MTLFKKYKIYLIFILLILLMLGGILGWNYLIDKQNPKSETPEVDLSDVNNISSVEAKLGSDIKITQGYLLTYTRKKSTVWYSSTGIVRNVSIKNDVATIYLSSSTTSDKLLKTTIEASKWLYHKDDTLNFVGTINFSDGSLNLSNISESTIAYQNISSLEIDDLIDNINQIKTNYFIINGYLITEGSTYKLFDSKEAYQKDNSITNYFTISWQDDFNLTGTNNVTIKCLISNTYQLSNCTLLD